MLKGSIVPSAIEEISEVTRKKLLVDSQLQAFMNADLQIPKIDYRTGGIRLIILGQDPTVLSEKRRRKIRMVLNLDRGGSRRDWWSVTATSYGPMRWPRVRQAA